MERFEEVDKEVEEKVDQILQEVAKFSFEDILNYALKSEEEAIKLYTFLSKKIAEPHAKMKFEQFIRSEEEHRDAILGILKELFPDKKPKSVKDKTWVEVSIKEKSEIKSAADYVDVLKIAIEGEKLAEKIYTFIAQNTPCGRYREIFLSLAKGTL